MSAELAADQPVCSFRDFTVDLPFEKTHLVLGEKPACLADYIRVWVECGDGVRACLGDHQVFLIAVIAIINDWTEDPQLLDFVDGTDPETGRPRTTEHRVETIFGKDELRHVILNPHWFATFTFRELHGRQTNS